VSQLAAGIALHGLSLAVTGKVVGTTALVAGGRARTASEASPSEASETTTGRGNSTSHTSTRVGAVAGQMAGVTAAVASSAGTSSAQAESGAVSLDVSEALAVVALLGLGGTGMRAPVGLVTGLLAVVAEPLRRRAHLSVVAHVSALETGTARKGRHIDSST
jgi:hypothetical protein